MIGGVIVTHGFLAQALLESARLIVGETPRLAAVGLEPGDGPEVCERKLRQAVEEVDDGDGVLVLTDLPGGTPCNVGLQCGGDGSLEVVTGVNLSMVVKLGALQAAGMPLAEVADRIAEYGIRSIRVATRALRAAQPAGRS